MSFRVDKARFCELKPETLLGGSWALEEEPYCLGSILGPPIFCKFPSMSWTGSPSLAKRPGTYPLVRRCSKRCYSSPNRPRRPICCNIKELAHLLSTEKVGRTRLSRTWPRQMVSDHSLQVLGMNSRTDSTKWSCDKESMLSMTSAKLKMLRDWSLNTRPRGLRSWRAPSWWLLQPQGYRQEAMGSRPKAGS